MNASVWDGLSELLGDEGCGSVISMASGTTGASGASAATRLSAAGGPPGSAPFSFAKIFSQPLALAAAADIPPLSRKRARRRESSSAGPDSSDSPFARFGPFAAETQGGFRVGAEAAVVTPDAPAACSVPGGTPRATMVAASVIPAPLAPSGGRSGGADGGRGEASAPLVATVTSSSAAVVPAAIDTQATTAECIDSLSQTLDNRREDEAVTSEARISVEDTNIEIAVSAASEDGRLSSKASNNRERKRLRKLAREAQPAPQAAVGVVGASASANVSTSNAAAGGVVAVPTFESAGAELSESAKLQAAAQISETPASIAAAATAPGDDLARVASLSAGASSTAASAVSAHDFDAEISALRSENERLREQVRSLRAEEISRLTSENAKLSLEALRLRARRS